MIFFVQVFSIAKNGKVIALTREADICLGKNALRRKWKSVRRTLAL